MLRPNDCFGFRRSLCMAIAMFSLGGCLIPRAFSQQPSAQSEPETTKRTIVIAHRGASGYLPEHTEGAKVLAIAQGADYVEQDVVLTRDGVCIVSHDLTMQDTTDVATAFPNRKRTDGKFYFIDFDWTELQSLRVHERRSANQQQVFPNRFPGGFNQRIMRLEDELTMIQGLERSLGRSIGVYVELKGYQFHREQGKDLASQVLGTLGSMGYRDRDDRCFVQCFEPAALEHLHDDLNCRLKLIELLGGRAAKVDAIKERLPKIARYAHGIGPAIELTLDQASERPTSNGLVESARACGLAVHVYTVRKDALPTGCTSLDQLHELLIGQLKVDGFFTDFPDLGRKAVDSLLK